MGAVAEFVRVQYKCVHGLEDRWEAIHIVRSTSVRWVRDTVKMISPNTTERKTRA